MEKKYNQQQNKNTHNKIKIHTTFKQRTLFGNVQVKKQFKLNKNQLEMLEIFYINPDAKITQKKLFGVVSVHNNTIANFIQKAELKEWIVRLKINPGIMVNTLTQFYQAPDTFEDKTIVPDKRAAYFQITKHGMEVFEINNNE